MRRMVKKKRIAEQTLTLDVSLPTYELREGMFVSDVDCGWEKTPFKVQGLLITSPEQIAVLSELTEFVTVDPARSLDLALSDFLEKTFGSGNYGLGYDDAETLGALTAVEAREPAADAEASANKPALGMPAAAALPPALQRRQTLLSGAGQWLNRIFSPFGNAQKTAPEPQPSVRPHYIPSNIELVSYAEPEFTWPTMPVAVTACGAAVSVLEQVAGGIAMKSSADLRKLERAAQSLAEHMIAHPSAMMWAAKMQETNDQLYQRSLEAGIYLTAFGRHLGFPREPLADLAMSGILLDIGKVRLSESLLEKPGPLKEADLHSVRSHVSLGMDMLDESGELRDTVIRAVAEHHEQISGNGYPRGLKESQISIYGKMAAIVDAYVAMVNPRPYAKTLAPHEAIKELFEGADRHWFEPLVEQFVQAIGIFPVGSLVEMASGHVAIVVQHNRIRHLEPKILIVTHSDKRPRLPPMQIDMLKHNTRRKQSGMRILRGLPDGAYGIDVRDYYFGPR